MVFCIQIIACRRFILALLLASTLADHIGSNLTLSQLNTTMEPGFTRALGSHPNAVSKPGPTMGYTEQRNLTLYAYNVSGNELLFSIVDQYCGKRFEQQIQSIGQQQRCNWTIIASLYSNVTECSEGIMELVHSYWPNEVGESFFIQMHSRYFKDCNMFENRTLNHPPDNIVLALVTAPICIIPIMVALVVWCSKNTEANAKK